MGSCPDTDIDPKIDYKIKSFLAVTIVAYH